MSSNKNVILSTGRIKHFLLSAQTFQANFLQSYCTQSSDIEEINRKRINIKKRALKRISSYLDTTIDAMLYYIIFYKMEVTQTNHTTLYSFWFYHIKVNESNKISDYYHSKNDILKYQQRKKYFARYCTFKYECVPTNKMRRINNDINATYDSMFDQILELNHQNEFIELTDHKNSRFLINKGELLKIINKLNQSNEDKNNTIDIKDIDGNLHQFSIVGLQMQYNMVRTIADKNYITIPDIDKNKRIISMNRYDKIRGNKFINDSNIELVDYYGEKVILNKKRHLRRSSKGLIDKEVNLTEPVKTIETIGSFVDSNNNHEENKIEPVTKSKFEGAEEKIEEEIVIGPMKEDDQEEIVKMPKKPMKKINLKSMRKPKGSSVSSNRSKSTNNGKGNEENDFSKKELEDTIEKIANGEEIDNNKSIIIYDKDKKHKREENLALYTKQYLKRYYLSDELPKEHQYIKDRSGNLSEPQLGNKVKIDDEDIYIKLNDSSITLKELKAFLNNASKHEAPTSFSSLYCFIANKYCNRTNENTITPRYLAMSSDISNVNTDNKTITPLVLIADNYNTKHLVDKRTINPKNKNLVLVDVLSNTPFTPNEQDIEIYSPESNSENIYELNNDKGDIIYVRYPFIKKLLNDLEHRNNIPSINKVYDSNMEEHNISSNEVERLLPFTDIAQCLNESNKYEKEIKVRMIDNKVVLLPREVIVSFIERIKHKEQLSNKERYYDIEGNEKTINPYRIRPLYQINERYSNLPYELINDDNVYYLISNLVTKTKEYIPKEEVVSGITNNSTQYYIDELKCAISPYNDNYTFIEVLDNHNEKLLIPKILLTKVIYTMTQNQCAPDTLLYDNHTIPVKDNLLNLYHITPSPYAKDDSLKNSSNSYIQKENNTFSPIHHLNDSNDLYEYMTINDIYGQPFIVRKPFVRALLFINKNDLLHNIEVFDSALQKRIICPYDIIEKNRENKIEIDEKNVFMEVEGKFISKIVYNKCTVLYMNKEIDKEMKIRVFDYLNEELIVMDVRDIVLTPKKYWVIIEDVNYEKIIVHKSKLRSLLNTYKTEIKEECELYDYFLTLRKINLNNVKMYLNKTKPESVYKIQFN